MLTPTEIRRVESRALLVRWSDATTTEIPSEALRKSCPCASCKEARGDSSHSSPLTGRKALLRVVESTRDEELQLTEVRLVGNYAVGLTWADGHDTGIYPFDMLQQLGRAQA